MNTAHMEYSSAAHHCAHTACLGHSDDVRI
jgi:translation elongation factor EF-Tu-like GTPase